MDEKRKPHSVPHTMRTTAEWLRIFHRVAGGTWHGVTNGKRWQCPVCFHMFEPRKGGNQVTTRYCSKRCCDLASKSREHARRLKAAHYTKPEVIALPIFGAYTTNPPMHICKAATTI